MRILFTSLKKIIPFIVIGILSLFFQSCSSSQSVADRDGIYNTTPTANTEYATESETDDKNNYYKQYFKSKTSLYDQLPEEDVIFTDIESYSTSESLDDDGYVITEEKEYDDLESYGSWGSNTKDVTVNVYNTGWGYAGWGYTGWYGHGWGWGYGGWYRPWGYYSYWGSPYWGWNIGYWGGFYNPWYCSPHYYNPYFYGGYYGKGGHYYASNYNRGRRNSNYIAGRSAYNRGRSNVATSGRGYSNSELNRRSSRNNSSIYRGRPNTNSSTSRPNSGYTRPNTTRPNYNNTRPSNTRPNYNNTRPSTNTRPSYSRPSTNSGGSINRGGGSSRSSGGRRGGRG
ncbi:MAG: hypothetical protein R2786_00170 [Flavobacteriaceae bacterium]